MAETAQVVTELAETVGVVTCPPRGRVTISYEGVEASGEIVCWDSGEIVMIRLDGTGDNVHVPDSLVRKEQS